MSTIDTNEDFSESANKPVTEVDLQAAAKAVKSEMDAEFDVTPAPVPPERKPEEQEPSLAEVTEGLTPDDRKAVAEMVSEALGIDADDVTAITDMAREYRETRVAQNFIESHPDYLPCQENWERFQKVLQENNLTITSGNLDAVYDHLSKQSQLKTAPKSRPVSSNLSDRHSARIVEAQPESPEDFARKVKELPLEQARDLVLRQLYEIRKARGENPRTIK